MYQLENLGGCDQNDRDIKKQLINEKLLQLPLLKNDKIVEVLQSEKILNINSQYIYLSDIKFLCWGSRSNKKCMIYKIPELIRQADIIFRDYIRQNNLRSRHNYYL